MSMLAGPLALRTGNGCSYHTPLDGALFEYVRLYLTGATVLFLALLLLERQLLLVGDRALASVVLPTVLLLLQLALG